MNDEDFPLLLNRQTYAKFLNQNLKLCDFYFVRIASEIQNYTYICDAIKVVRILELQKDI